jgi:GT2 family glycosyltransferase
LHHSITTIIVSYNTCDTTLRCLNALLADRPVGGHHEVVVFDNASSDGSPDAIAERFPQVRLIRSGQNIGFGPANNRAIARAAEGADLLLLNSDAFVHSNAIAQLGDYLYLHPRVGVVGPKLLNADGSLQPSVWPFPTPVRSWIEALGLSPMFKQNFALRDWRRWTYDRSGRVPWLIGACLLVRREVIDTIGGFDESFFLYGEETEWERRVRDGGWEIHFVADAVVTHLGGESGLSAKEWTRSLFFDGLDRYLKKHHGVGGIVASRAAMVVGGLLRWPIFIALALRGSGRGKFKERAAQTRWMIRRQLADWQCLRSNWTR